MTQLTDKINVAEKAHDTMMDFAASVSPGELTVNESIVVGAAQSLLARYTNARLEDVRRWI